MEITSYFMDPLKWLVGGINHCGYRAAPPVLSWGSAIHNCVGVTRDTGPGHGEARSQYTRTAAGQPRHPPPPQLSAGPVLAPHPGQVTPCSTKRSYLVRLKRILDLIVNCGVLTSVRVDLKLQSRGPVSGQHQQVLLWCHIHNFVHKWKFWCILTMIICFQTPRKQAQHLQKPRSSHTSVCLSACCLSRLWYF